MRQWLASRVIADEMRTRFTQWWQNPGGAGALGAVLLVYQALGLINDQLHMLVFTPRKDAAHVISLRRANQRERTRYASQAKP